MVLGMDRGRLEIIADIIDHTTETLIISHLMHKANLSYIQLMKYLPAMLSVGFIQITKQGYLATDKGREYLSYYDKLKQLISFSS